MRACPETIKLKSCFFLLTSRPERMCKLTRLMHANAVLRYFTTTCFVQHYINRWWQLICACSKTVNFKRWFSCWRCSRRIYANLNIMLGQIAPYFTIFLACCHTKLYEPKIIIHLLSTTKYYLSIMFYLLTLQSAKICRLQYNPLSNCTVFCYFTTMLSNKINYEPKLTINFLSTTKYSLVIMFFLLTLQSALICRLQYNEHQSADYLL
jgi:hypothetical protein